MTDSLPTDDNNELNSQEQDAETNEENQDADPMLAGLEEAEAEVKAQEEGSNEDDSAEKPETSENEDNGKETPETKDEPIAKEPMMVPKARFDEVLSERNLLRNQTGYMRGIIDARDGQANAQQSNGTDDKADKDSEGQEGSEIDLIETSISEAEEKKLELAEKYDAGEISTVDLKKGEFEIDKDIRVLLDQRDTANRQVATDESKAHTDQALNASQQANAINEQALVIQKNHPNVAMIDATSNSKFVWGQISEQAIANLTARGIDVGDNSLNSRIAYMREKASLTDGYTHEELKRFLPEGYIPPTQKGNDSQDKDSKIKPSETALNRSKKLDLADEQPPIVAGMDTGTKSSELTEADIEGMSQDELADLMETAPQLVQRAIGEF